MSDEITKEEGAELAKRNPVPPATREIQNLEVDKGVPPAPEPQKPDENAKLKEELTAMEAKLEGYKRGNQAKDKAIEDMKNAAEEAAGQAAPRIEDPTDIQALIDAAVSKQVAAADEARDARNAPFRASVAELTRENADKAAIAEVGADAVEKFRDAADEQLRQTPGLTRAQAYKLVVPAGTTTAPAVPVAGARTPAPDAPVDRSALYLEKVGEARGLSTRGDFLKRRGTLEEAVKIGAASLMPHGGQGG